MTPTQITITLIEAPKGCPKCEECIRMVGRLQERWPGRIEFKIVPAESPEVADYGVIMPPMLLLEDFIVVAGKVPVESGLLKLVAKELGEETPK